MNSPALSYLYYMSQIGVAISPLSNNALFLALKKHPFYDFHRQGLNMSLSTDDPMQFHTTADPLIEEYTISQQFWKMSTSDVSEIAKNSVMQSGLTDELKTELLGPSHMHRFENDANLSNLVDIRVHFRKRCYNTECEYLAAFTEQFAEEVGVLTTEKKAAGSSHEKAKMKRFQTMNIMKALEAENEDGGRGDGAMATASAAQLNRSPTASPTDGKSNLRGAPTTEKLD